MEAELAAEVDAAAGASSLESRWVEGSTGRIHARWSVAGPAWGGPPIVLVHGLVISSIYMVPLAEVLGRRYPVVAPDLPGFGLSAKPERVLDVGGLADGLLNFLDAAALPPQVVLLGNSLGCQVAVDLAVRFPSRVLALVLAGPTMDRAARTAPRQIGRWMIDWTREPPSLAAAHLRDYGRAGLRRAWRTFRHALADPIEEKVGQLTCPTLMVRGSHDPIVPARWLSELAVRAGAETAEIRKGPHVVNYTRPRALAELTEDFLRRRLQPRATAAQRAGSG
jgi:2-hydroxy-6-oxonona-2,4-dienedioate hydrolase